MGKDTCDRCIHCTHIEGDEIVGHYYYCEVDNEYVSEVFALDETIGCDVFVEQELDDNKTKKS